MFPYVVQPLHIFEPRYRAMVADALESDRLIAMVLLRPGWEPNYDGAPPIHEVCCIGRITAEERLPDGRFNILLYGLRRARMIEELQTGTLYRTARVVLLDDVYPSDGAAQRDQARERLVDLLRQTDPKMSEAEQPLARLLDSRIPLGAVADLVSYGLALPPAEKQQLLEELDVDTRVQRLIDHLKQGAALRDFRGQATTEFPPKFSVN